MTNREKILAAINRERERQDKKWGKTNAEHPSVMIAVLVEEVGEVARAWLEGGFKSDDGNYYDELIQVAAVAVAMAEGCYVVQDHDNRGEGE